MFNLNRYQIINQIFYEMSSLLVEIIKFSGGLFMNFLMASILDFPAKLFAGSSCGYWDQIFILIPWIGQKCRWPRQRRHVGQKSAKPIIGKSGGKNGRRGGRMRKYHRVMIHCRGKGKCRPGSLTAMNFYRWNRLWEFGLVFQSFSLSEVGFIDVSWRLW